MRRTLPAILAGLSLALLAAAGARNTESQNGNYKSAQNGEVRQSPPPMLDEGGSFRVDAYPLYPPELAAGDGRQETSAYCAMCHSTRYITMQPPLPAATWEAEVNKMNKTFGANIPPAVTEKIIRYLVAHYTPKPQ